MGEKLTEAATGNSHKEWSGVDLVACILSALSYLGILAGMSLLLLNLWTGYLLTALALIAAIVMFLVIDPKLRRVSSRYEKKQKEYLEELDRIIEWKKTDET